MPWLSKRAEKGFYAFALVNSALGANSLLIPLFVKDGLQGTVGQVGLIVSAASLAGLPASIFWGSLSDRWKRRKYFLIFGFSGVAIALALMSLAQNAPQLLILNAFMNFMWMASASVSTLIVIEGIDRNKWESKIGSFNRYVGVGWVSGLILGSLWMWFIDNLFPAPLGMRYLFLVLSLLAFLSILLAISWIKEGEVKFGRRRFLGLSVIVGSMLLERFRFAPFHIYHIAKPKNLYELLIRRSKFGDLTIYFYAMALFFTGFNMFFVPFPLFLKDILRLSGAQIYALTSCTPESAPSCSLMWAGWLSASATAGRRESS